MTKFDQQMFNDIIDELKRARTKFPYTEDLMTALTEEVGELAQALLDIKYKKTKTARDVWEEAVQVANLAIRIATEGDSNFPQYNPSEAQKTL